MYFFAGCILAGITVGAVSYNFQAFKPTSIRVLCSGNPSLKGICFITAAIM